VFLAVFIILIVVTLQYPDLPPGLQIYYQLGLPETEYPVLGLPATTLVIALFNGILYGVIVWLFFTFAEKAKGRKTAAKSETHPPIQPKKFCLNWSRNPYQC